MYLRATTTYGSLIPGSEYIRSLVRQGTISPAAAASLKWMDHYAEHRNARLTCRHFDISPQSYVERSNRTHREEFYEVEDIAIRLDEHNQQLERWNQTYNYVRPHQSLAQLTPNEYYRDWVKRHKAARCH